MTPPRSGALRFASLGSGSRGNGLVVEAGQTRILVDCGFTLKETERRLARLGLRGDQLTAVLVTHEHSDHIGGVGPLARRHGVPVWMTPGTRAVRDIGRLPALELFNCHEPLVIGDIEISPFPVPHDAREPSQFIFGDGAARLGLLTDAGCGTQHIIEMLSGCEALFIECNHDPEMLANGPYPPALQARVGGRLGHLSNGQAAEVVANCKLPRLHQIVAGHLSEKNNTPALAREELAQALGCEPSWIAVADQDEGLSWRDVA